jgi:flagellar motility protein MotE (MotC chaperone)
VVALRAGKRAGLEPKDRMTPAQLISMAVLVQQEKLKLLEDGKEKMQAGVNPALVELIQETIWEMSDDQIAFMMENNLLPWDEIVKQLRAATRIEGVIEGTIVPDDDKDEQKQ